MVDEAVVADRLQSIDRYIEELQFMRDLDRDSYLEDIVQQRAVERTLITLVQSCVDLASHIRASENLGPAETSKEEIEALGTNEIITDVTESKVIEAVGLRNFLVHRYTEIDHDIVYDVVHGELHWFQRFQQEVASWLRDEVDPSGNL